MDSFTDLTIMAAIIPVVLALVEVCKRTFMDVRWAPLAAMAIGICLAFLFDWAQADVFVRGNIPENAIAGILAGLAASGLYSGIPAITQRQG